MKNDSRGSSKIQVKLWVQLCRSIHPLENLCDPKNWGKPTADCMALISKSMWFLTNTHETRGKIIITLHFYLIKHVDTRWFEIICHFLLYAYSIWLIWNNPSSYCISLFLYLREAIISSKKWRYMHLSKQKGPPLCITGGVIDHQSCLSGISTQQSIYNQQPTHLMNSPRSKGFFKFSSL